jgi:hypothetical protein
MQVAEPKHAFQSGCNLPHNGCRPSVVDAHRRTHVHPADSNSKSQVQAQADNHPLTTLLVCLFAPFLHNLRLYSLCTETIMHGGQHKKLCLFKNNSGARKAPHSTQVDSRQTGPKPSPHHTTARPNHCHGSAPSKAQAELWQLEPSRQLEAEPSLATAVHLLIRFRLQGRHC